MGYQPVGAKEAEDVGLIGELCLELGITRQTLYRHIGPEGSLRKDGEKTLNRKTRQLPSTV
jgi:hypothetical protein